MFNAAGPSLPRPREEVPCLGAGGAPCLLPARLMPGLPRPVLAGRGVFLQRHGRPSSRERLPYSARTARRTRSINSRSFIAAH